MALFLMLNISSYMAMLSNSKSKNPLRFTVSGFQSFSVKRAFKFY